MTEQPAQSAAEAFEALRQEVALLRMNVQQLLNERQAPDYSQTLGKIMRDMKEASKGMTFLVNSAAIQVPAEELASRISAAGNLARQQDRETIRDAARALTQAMKEIDGCVARARNLQAQKLWLCRIGLSAAGGGVVLGAFVAIGLCHLAPEQSVRWIIGMDQRKVEQRVLSNCHS